MRPQPQPTAPEVNSIVQSRFVTKQRPKDFNGNHPNFHEILTTNGDDYTKYRDISTEYSTESTEDETDECVSVQEQIPEPSDPVLYQGAPDESFNAAELNKTESPNCCPILPRRRSFDKKAKDQVRQTNKRRSQDKRIATHNTQRIKSTTQSTNASTNSSNNSTANSSDALLPKEPMKNCNNLNASDKEDVSCDFESLMHNKISELEFKEDIIPDSTTDDQFHGSRNFTHLSHFMTNSNKRFDADPFYISSRLPQLSRPSEMFIKTPNFQNFTVSEEVDPAIVEQNSNVNPIMSRFTSLRTFTDIGLLIFVIMLIYFYYILKK